MKCSSTLKLEVSMVPLSPALVGLLCAVCVMCSRRDWRQAIRLLSRRWLLLLSLTCSICQSTVQWVGSGASLRFLLVGSALLTVYQSISYGLLLTSMSRDWSLAVGCALWETLS